MCAVRRIATGSSCKGIYFSSLLSSCIRIAGRLHGGATKNHIMGIMRIELLAKHQLTVSGGYLLTLSRFTYLCYTGCRKGTRPWPLLISLLFNSAKETESFGQIRRSSWTGAWPTVPFSKPLWKRLSLRRKDKSPFEVKNHLKRHSRMPKERNSGLFASKLNQVERLQRQIRCKESLLILFGEARISV